MAVDHLTDRELISIIATYRIKSSTGEGVGPVFEVRYNQSCVELAARIERGRRRLAKAWARRGGDVGPAHYKRHPPYVAANASVVPPTRPKKVRK